MKSLQGTLFPYHSLFNALAERKENLFFCLTRRKMKRKEEKKFAFAFD